MKETITLGVMLETAVRAYYTKRGYPSKVLPHTVTEYQTLAVNCGDGLLTFIITELIETFNPEGKDLQGKRETAFLALVTAAEQLEAVKEAIDTLDVDAIREQYRL